jgi:hypothetical protein
MLDSGIWMLERTRKEFIRHPVSSIQIPSGKEKS